MSLHHLVLAVVAAASGARAQLVPPRTQGTLTVEYLYQSAGKAADPQGNDHRDWRVSRRVGITVKMVAENPSPVAALLPATAGQQAVLGERQDLAARGAGKAMPMMADIQQLLAKCGEDEACMQREGARLAGGMNTAAMRSAGEDAAAAARPMSRGFQLWRTVSYEGRYVADELYNAALADPDCLAAPRSRCVSQTRRAASGPIPITNNPQVAMLEVDATGQRLHVGLPIAAGNLPVTRTVTGKVPDGSTGTFADQMPFPWTRIQPLQVRLSAGLDGASGSQQVQIAGERGEGGTLSIRWQFKRAP